MSAPDRARLASATVGALVGSACRSPVALGFAAWSVVVLALRPHPYDEAWARAVLCFAPAVLLPAWTGGPAPLLDAALWRAVPSASARAAWWFAAACGVGASQVVAPRGLGVALLVPWGALVGLVAWRAARELAARTLGTGHRPEPRSALDADAFGQLVAPLFAAVGVAWAAFDRAGVRPLDLPAELVLLTAIHFHFAGAVLPLAAAWAERGRRGPRAWLAVVAAAAGVPLVAAGITATQLGAPPIVEALAATLMAAGGAWVAWRVAARGRRADRVTRALATGAALCLAAGMALAAAYAWRARLDLAWMGIPAMRGWHGTLNGIGFGLAATLAARRAPSA